MAITSIAAARPIRAPVTVSSLSALVALPSVSGAFDNGNDKKSVQVADGQSVSFGITASDIGTGLMQALKDIAGFDAGASGNFNGSSSLSQAQNDFLTDQIASVGTVATDLNTATAAEWQCLSTSCRAPRRSRPRCRRSIRASSTNIQNTNMAEAATQLSLNQTALQAALQVTSTLNKLTLAELFAGVRHSGG